MEAFISKEWLLEELGFKGDRMGDKVLSGSTKGNVIETFVGTSLNFVDFEFFEDGRETRLQVEGEGDTSILEFRTRGFGFLLVLVEGSPLPDLDVFRKGAFGELGCLGIFPEVFTIL